jgi:hypothetical protein
MSFDDQSHYFFVLHQIEIDLDIFHDELLEADKKKLDYWIEEWFKRRGNVTGEQRKVSSEFKQGVFNWKEVERELESE